MGVTCCFRLHTLLHVVVCCCVLLGAGAQSLKPVKRLTTCKRTQELPTFLAQHCWELLLPFAHGFMVAADQSTVSYYYVM